MLSALHTIGTYPFDLGGPIFAHYPAMKFGHCPSVDYFAELLVPLALKALADTGKTDRGWVLTSPPLRGLPCGANLVCRALCGRLAKVLPDGQAPRLAELGRQGPRTPFRDPTDFAAYHDYSKYDLKKRRQFRAVGDERAACDPADFAGCYAVFVNDINVTGSQLAAVTKLLRNAGVKSLGALLIVNVDEKIGCVFPQVENEINTSSLNDLAAFTAFLRDCEFEPTGKLISCLMSHGDHAFATIFESLRPPKRQMLHRAILQEGLYGDELFKEKLALVERAVCAE